MARIVIVDDDEVLAEVVAEALSNAGHLVSAVHHGNEALVAVTESQPDLVILDYSLPGKTGFQILREIRAYSTNDAIPVMIFSGRGGGLMVGRAMIDGADDYVTKPTDPACVVARSEALLRSAQVARQISGVTG